MRKFDVKKMVILSSFAAISVVLYCFLKFKLPSLFPSFLEFNFSMLPIVITVYMFGPVEGIIIAALRFAFKILFMGTGTQYVGELADFLIATIVSFFVWIPYHFIGDKLSVRKKTAISMLCGSVMWIIGAVILNWLLLVPAYKELFFKGDIMPLVGMCKAAIPNINENNFMVYYLFLGVVPFNLVLSVVVFIISSIVHMRTYQIFDMGNHKLNNCKM